MRERVADVRARIDRSARAAGREPSDVTLIAVTKTHPAEVLQLAIEAGLVDLGENRVQEADGKISQLGRNAARWHLIGHLQGNKARRAVELFDFIHSLDSVSLARRLDRLCHDAARAELPVFVQVDLAHETTKAGAREDELPGVIEAIGECERLRLVGLMTLPPFFDDAEMARPFFRRLRELRDDLKAQAAFGDGQGELSMGMSNDFGVAVEEGATFVRVGTAIFGHRVTAITSHNEK
jgi:pyridoxal phosphate enzyme (YggS family)